MKNAAVEDTARTAAAPPADWTRRLWAPLVLLAVAGLPYAISGALFSGWVFDDLKLVKENESIRDLGGIGGTFDITSDAWDEEPLRANYRPLRFLSYAVDYELARWFAGDAFVEDDPPVFVFHLTNLLLHIANTLLVLSIGRRLLGHGPAAFFLALLFALHPIQTEAVVYISGRRDVLSMLFFLAALRLYLGARDVALHDPRRPLEGPGAVAFGYFAGASGRDVGWVSLVAIPLLFVCGLLSKEMVVTLPAVLILIDLAAREPLRPRRCALHVVLWAVALGFTALEVSNPALVAAPIDGKASSTALMAPRYVARYFFLMLFPASQSIDYSFDAIPVSSGLFTPLSTFISACFAAAGIVTGLWLLATRRALPAVGLLWFLGTLTPVLHIVPIPERFAERFLYLPGLGVLVLGAIAFLRLERKETILSRGLGTLVVLVLLVATYARCRDWRTPRLLWESAVEAYPSCARAHIGLANELREGGLSLHDAVRGYTKAIELLESDPDGLAREPLRRGQLLQARLFRAESLARLGAEMGGMYERAVADYLWLLEQTDVDGTPVAESEEYAVVDYQLGSCYLGMREWDLAAERFERLVERGRPESFVRASHYFLAKVHLATGKVDEAVAEFGKAWEIVLASGTLRDRYNLAGEYADALIQARDFDAARRLLDEVIADLAASEEPELRDGRKHLLYRVARIHDLQAKLSSAIRVLETCISIDERYGPALLLLASIEENRGDLDRARELYARVLQVSPGNQQAERGLQSIDIKKALAEKDGVTTEEQAEKLRLVKGLLDRGEKSLEELKLSAASELLRKVVDTEVDPQSEIGREVQDLRARALWRLGQIGVKYNKPAEAEAFFLAALDADGALGEALLDLADLELAQGKHEEARRHYEDYLGGLPRGALGPPHVSYNLGLLAQREAPERALEYFEMARKAGHAGPEIERQLGYALTQLGRYEEALERFEAFLETSDSAHERDLVRHFIVTQVLPNLDDGKALRDREREE